MVSLIGSREADGIGISGVCSRASDIYLSTFHVELGSTLRICRV